MLNWFQKIAADFVTAEPGEIGYDPSWGDYHKKVEFKPDYWNYGPAGYFGPPMPMPKKVYHATPYPEKILAEGFKTPKTVGSQTFGGGSEFMSFTSFENAKLYQEALKDMVRVANGQFDHMGLEESFRYLANKWGGTEEQRLKGLIDMVQGWQEYREKEGLRHDVQRGLVDFFGYAHNHGIEVPFLFGGSEQILEKFKKMNPDDIGIIEVETNPSLNWHNGANIWHDTDMSTNYTYNKSENEWRVFAPEMIKPIRRVA